MTEKRDVRICHAYYCLSYFDKKLKNDCYDVIKTRRREEEEKKREEKRRRGEEKKRRRERTRLDDTTTKEDKARQEETRQGRAKQDPNPILNLTLTPTLAAP